jgi:hypothetical protein
MREDDLEIGKICRDIIHIHRVGIFQPHPHAAGHAGADAGLAGMKQRDRAGLIDHLVQRVGHAIVGKKALHGRVEFESLDAIFLDQLARFAHPQLALVRIDADKGYQHVGIFSGNFQHLVVVVAAEPGLALGIDRKNHRSDFLGAIVGRGFRYRRRMLVRRLEVLGHLRLEVVVTVVAMHAAGLFRMGVDVDRNDVFDAGDFEFCHSASIDLGRLAKLIILYN